MYNLVLDKKFTGPARNFSPVPAPVKNKILVPIPSQSRRDRDRDHLADPCYERLTFRTCRRGHKKLTL